MRRRGFLAVLGGVAAMWLLAALAQRSTMPVVGFVNIASAEGYASQLFALRLP
jgi:hypothetical protein